MATAIDPATEPALTDGQKWALQYLPELVREYLGAILDTETDENTGTDHCLARLGYDERDFHPSARAAAERDCRAFLLAVGDAVLADEDAGHTEMSDVAGYAFWHERTGGGVGFWDGRWPEASAEACSAAAEAAGLAWWYVADNGQIFQSGEEPGGPWVKVAGKFVAYWAECPVVSSASSRPVAPRKSRKLGGTFATRVSMEARC
jgi:hypothetical protein